MLANPQSVVPDHALLRWLDRVYGIDMEFFRNELFERVRDVAASGATQWVSDDGTFCFTGGKLVTVLAPGTRSRLGLANNQMKRMKNSGGTPNKKVTPGVHYAHSLPR